jgi:hypothetical protein
VKLRTPALEPCSEASHRLTALEALRNNDRVSRLALTPLEQEVWDLWDKLVFKEGWRVDGPQSEEWWRDLYKAQSHDWQRLHDLSYENGWKVGVFTAGVVASSLWFKAMAERDFGQAKQAILRWLTHPDEKNAEPSTRCDFRSRLGIAQFAAGEQVEGAATLTELLDANIRSKREVARTISQHLHAHHPFFDLEAQAPPELSSLVTELMLTLKKPKKTLTRVANCNTTCELMQLLTS